MSFRRVNRILTSFSSSNSFPNGYNGATYCFSSSASSSARPVLADLRSDTVTQPTPAMLQSAMEAATGDDVLGEDPTVNALEEHVASLFGKEASLFVPTGTMGNMCAILAHCHANKSSEMLLGRRSHIHLYEGGGYANLAGVSARQLDEDEDAMFAMDDLRDAFRSDDDDHYAKTQLLCLENTHNMLGGVALPLHYIASISRLTREEWGGVKLHVDGARLFHALAARSLSPADMASHVDSISVCLSKGLGAPAGAMLVGDREFVRLARRARKRLGGGMRQSGVLAAMGLYALNNHVGRLEQDHFRAKRLASELWNAGFWLPREGKVDTNVVFFALPDDCPITKEELPQLLLDGYGVKIAGGYSKGGRLFRLVTHMDVNDDGIDATLEGIIHLCKR